MGNGKIKTTNPDVPQKLHSKVKIFKEEQSISKVPQAYEAITPLFNAVSSFYDQISEIAEDNNATKSETTKEIIQKGLKEVKNSE